MKPTESIMIAPSDGPRLAGILHHPSGPSTGLAVVVAHGMLSFKGSDKHRAICEALAGAGATALRFDFRGRGESEGDPADLTVSNEVVDFTSAVSFLRDLGFMRIAAVGSSLGGTVSLLAGASDRELTGLVTIAAPARFPDGPREAWGGSGKVVNDQLIEVAPGEFIHRDFFADAATHDPIGAAGSIGCPWLIIHGANDPVVPVEDAHLLAKNAPKAEVMIHPTAGHRFDGTGEREWLVNRVEDFLVKR